MHHEPRVHKEIINLPFLFAEKIIFIWKYPFRPSTHSAFAKFYIFVIVAFLFVSSFKFCTENIMKLRKVYKGIGGQILQT